MEPSETPSKVVPVGPRPDIEARKHRIPLDTPLTAEEYAGIKAKYPNLEYNDEEQKFLTKSGNWSYARRLLRFTPLNDEQRTMGRNKWNSQRGRVWDRFIEALEKGKRVSDACAMSGLAYSTVKNRRNADPEFAERWAQAEMIAAEPVEDSLFDAARAGNVPAAIKWLEKRAPERWPGDKVQIEQKNIYEIDASDRIGSILAMVERLKSRAELEPVSEVIDVDAVEPMD